MGADDTAQLPHLGVVPPQSHGTPKVTQLEPPVVSRQENVGALDVSVAYQIT